MGASFLLRATVVSASSDTDFVAFRPGVPGLFVKRTLMKLVSEVDNGDGTFTRIYETSPLTVMHRHPGFFHMGVDAVTRGTVMDDQEPYSASWWGIPYHVPLF